MPELSPVPSEAMAQTGTIAWGGGCEAGIRRARMELKTILRGEEIGF